VRHPSAKALAVLVIALEDPGEEFIIIDEVSKHHVMRIIAQELFPLFTPSKE
jgi:hypothetical protein